MAAAGHLSRQRRIEHEEWPERSGRARVLIENPDGAELWVHAGRPRAEGATTSPSAA
jgi:hypothetical protein